MPEKRLRVMLFSWASEGHLSSLTGIANMLDSRGHEIIFLSDPSLEKSVLDRGYRVHVIKCKGKSSENVLGDMMEDVLIKSENLLYTSPKERIQGLGSMKQLFETIEDIDQEVEEAMIKYKPDLFIMDFTIFLPCIDRQRIPFIDIFSVAPQFFYDDNVPPPSSGYPSDDRSQWDEYKEIMIEIYKESIDPYKNFIEKSGYRWTPKNAMIFRTSPYLAVYSYPRCIDYPDAKWTKEDFFRVDTFGRDIKRLKKSNISTEFLAKPGKLIFFSLGSFFSQNVKVMNRVLEILAKSPHKFIVSKGRKGDQVVLHNNMWGENFVNQLQVLQMVDLAIIHGGNNSTIECFLHGVPMIIIPIVGDQFDNAQRVHEKKFGIRIDVKNLTEELLLDSIEKLLADDDLKKRLKQVSEEMSTSNLMTKLGERLEDIAQKGWIEREKVV